VGEVILLLVLFVTAGTYGHKSFLLSEEVAEISVEFKFFIETGLLALCSNPQPGGAGLHIYIPWRLGGPVIPPSTGYPFYSLLTTRMGYGGTILIPRSPHGEGEVIYGYKILVGKRVGNRSIGSPSRR
jgi:hypothetical protein